MNECLKLVIYLLFAVLGAYVTVLGVVHGGVCIEQGRILAGGIIWLFATIPLVAMADLARCLGEIASH